MADGSPSTFRVSFKEPLEIQQGEYYVASAKLKVKINLIINRFHIDSMEF